MFHFNHFYVSFVDSLYARRPTIQMCRFTTLEIICYTVILAKYEDRNSLLRSKCSSLILFTLFQNITTLS